MITVKANKNDSIILPKTILNRLGLTDGEKIDIEVTGDAIVFIREAEGFFNLEGALKDVDIETPLKELDKEWKNVSFFMEYSKVGK